MTLRSSYLLLFCSYFEAPTDADVHQLPKLNFLDLAMQVVFVENKPNDKKDY